jgi:hypothetical protein
VKVTGYHMVKKSMIESTTFYHIETRSNLEGLYDKDRVYKVERRFNDFK